LLHTASPAVLEIAIEVTTHDFDLSGSRE